MGTKKLFIAFNISRFKLINFCICIFLKREKKSHGLETMTFQFAFAVLFSRNTCQLYIYPTEREKCVYGFEKLQPLHTIFIQNSLYIFNFYRLCQVSIHSCRQTLFFIFSECICCHGNNRDCISILMFQ